MLSYQDYLRLLPKAELHCHFVATIRPTTLIELAGKFDVALPSDDPETLFDYDNIVDFLTVFAAAEPVFKTREVFARIAYESVADAVAAGNLKYREYFINATQFPLSYVDVIDAMIEGLRSAEQDYGVGFGIIPAIARSKSVAASLELVEQMIAHPRAEVVGLGQDYLRPDNTESPELWGNAYELAARHNINRTAHVGEIHGSTAAAVRIAIEDLKCGRIDHGYHVLDDPAVVELARESQIPFTCTPFSTRILSGWEIGPEHPVAQMIRAGLNVTLSTDDPTFFHTDIGREYVEGLPAMGFGPAVARQIALAGMAAAWCCDARRDDYLSRFRGEIRALDALLDPVAGVS